MNRTGAAPGGLENLVPYCTVALFSLWPFVNFTLANIFEAFSYSRLLLFALVFLLAALLAFKVAEKILFRGHAQAAAVYVSMLVVCFFAYEIISLAAHTAFGQYHLRTWAVIALLTFGVGFFAAKTKFLQVAAPFVGLAMVVLPLVQIALALSQDVEQLQDAADGAESESGQSEKIAQRRSVYYIMTDGYPRDDVLAELGHDNEPFLKSLEERGFYIAREARANYESTLFTLASQFFREYVITDEREVSVATVTARMQAAQKGDNPVHEFFLAEGYRTAILSSSARNCNPRIDLCASKSTNGFGLGQLEAKFLGLTPLIHLASKPSFANEYSYTPDLLKFLDEITALRPVFLFAHLLDVHPPFTYSKDCQQSFEGKTDFYHYYFEPEFFFSVKCANANLLKIADRLISADPDSIIVIAADHGSAFNLFVNGEYETSTDPGTLYERYASFAAWYLPAECQDSLYPGLSPVNTFRLVIPCLTEEKPQPRPDLTFFREDFSSGGHAWKRLPVELSRDKRPDLTRRLREKGLLAK